jgi:hypothetical protein
MKTFKVVKACKITGIVIAEREFDSYDAAYKFASEVAKLGYTPCSASVGIFASEKFYINIV